jgi:hypothetical protein
LDRSCSVLLLIGVYLSVWVLFGGAIYISDAIPSEDGVFFGASSYFSYVARCS